MAFPKNAGFTRRGPDHVTDELVTALSGGASYDIKDLFLIVHAGLKLKNAAGGGEEMMRLRCYEKLRILVNRGVVQKTGKNYQGLNGIEKASSVSVAS